MVFYILLLTRWCGIKKRYSFRHPFLRVVETLVCRKFPNDDWLSVVFLERTVEPTSKKEGISLSSVK